VHRQWHFQRRCGLRVVAGVTSTAPIESLRSVNSVLLQRKNLMMRPLTSIELTFPALVSV
jgi:hypothetical protein